MAKKTETKKAPKAPRIYTWNNGGRQQAIHESGAMVAEASPPSLLDIPQSFIDADGIVVLTKSCDIEAILEEEVGTHKGLEKALGACRKRQDDEKLAEPAGPVIIVGEVGSDFQGPVR